MLYGFVIYKFLRNEFTLASNMKHAFIQLSNYTQSKISNNHVKDKKLLYNNSDYL